MQTAERTARHLIFRLGAERFGVDVMQVREIVGVQSVTAVPHAAPGVKGVINLRGKVVPVIDLRERLGLVKVEATAKSSLIVVRTSQGEDALTVAMAVDEAAEVSRIADDIRLFDASEMLADTAGVKQ